MGSEKEEKNSKKKKENILQVFLLSGKEGLTNLQK